MSNHPQNQETHEETYSLEQMLKIHPWGQSELCRLAGQEEGGVSYVLRRIEPSKMTITPEALHLAWERLAALWHSHLVPVKDFTVHESEAYLVRDYVEGTPVLTALRGRPLQEILFLFEQLLELTEYLHGHNILLGWREPQGLAANLWLTQDSHSKELQLKLSDVGWEQALTFGRPEGNQLPVEFQHLAEKLPGRLHPWWDLRTIGALLYQALLQKPLSLFPTLKEIPALPEIAKCSASLEKFLRSLLSFKPGQAFAHATAAKQALQALLSTSSSTKKTLAWDEAQLFRPQFYPKTLKKVMLQGGHWAFTASAGEGKSHWARWLQRYLWRNGQEAWLLKGRDFLKLSFSFWEQANPEAFWIIDDADQGPVEAFLQQVSKPHLVFLGRDLSWLKNRAKKKSPCQEIPLPEPQQENPILKTEFFTSFEKPIQEVLLLLVVTQVPQSLNQLMLSLARLNNNSSRGRHMGSPQGDKGGHAGPPLPSNDEVEKLEKGGKDQAAFAHTLYQAVQQGILQRVLWQGQEYFLGTFSMENRPFKAFQFTTDSALRWSHFLKYQEAWEALAQWMQWTGLTQEKSQTTLLLKQSLAVAQAGQGAKFYQQAGKDFQKSKDLQGQVNCILALAGLTPTSQKKYLEAALAQIEKISDSPMKFLLDGKVHFAIAQFYQRATDWERAESYLLESVEQFWSAEFPAGIALAYSGLAQIFLVQGEVESAQSHLQEAIHALLLVLQISHQIPIFHAAAKLAEWQLQDALALQAWAKIVWLGERQKSFPSNLSPLIWEARLREVYYLEETRKPELATSKLKAILQQKAELKKYRLLGFAYLLQGKILQRNPKRSALAQKSFIAARSALEEMPDSPLSLEFLWECCLLQAELAFALENFSEAREHWQSAQEAMAKYRRSLGPYLQQVLLDSAKEERLQAVGKEVM